MASEQKQVRILTKSEQRQTIKGIKKPKKNIIKNYLESPFALEWPELTTGDEEAITALIQKTCKGLRKFECKPPWKQVTKYKGAERKSFLKECHIKFQENLDPDSKRQNDKRKEVLSHLIFGYNAVMRALEKDGVAGILVKKNVNPVFVTKSFLPGCAKKCIPLVPLNDLDMLLKDKETLSLPHACMVLGLKTSVKEESNLFYPLYIKMCEALCVEEEDMNEDVCENDELENSAADGLENKNSKCSYKLSETEISSYHLKRNGKGTRAFIPNAQEVEVKDSDWNMDFVGFKSLEDQNNIFKQDEAKSRKKVQDKLRDFNGAASVSENVDFSSMILIDASGDENLSVETDKVKDKASDVEKLPNKVSPKTKRKAKKVDVDRYISAKTKRLKGNPNKKPKHEKF
ncbi:hypothetical protein E2C01_006307 [Portunus trituberculatus]|uniref:Uncharacterized protein n=1 Tax=Portunus trituberculatus TaxID=210409 RepID=A0A5B7CVZ3_PORTR|nr:hypothetical protein [Portunus trituberculatus]